MGILSKLLKNLFPDSSLQRHQENIFEPIKTYSPEGFVVYEQEQSGKCWHGVPLCELSKLAQTTYRGRYVEVDQYGFLVFKYSSNSKKTQLSAQCILDENGRLKRMPHGYYPGQWRDSADDFVEKANQQFTFK